MEKEQKNLIIGLVIGAIIILVIVLIYNNSIGQTNQNRDDSSSAQSSLEECEDVQVPYQDTETYWDKELYIGEECNMVPLTYSKNLIECDTTMIAYINANNMECIITNTDTKSGNFVVSYGFKCASSTGGENWACYDGEKTLYISSGASQSVSGRYSDIDSEECFCNVEPAEKQVCKDITKYRDVQKTRMVTKYRTETVCD